VQECGTIEPDVDERRLHPGQNTGHLPQNDVADRASLLRAFDLEFGDDAVFDQRNAGLT
jgi:hypothetical protein